MTKDYNVAQLKEMAKRKGILGYSKLRKQELMNVLFGKQKRTASPVGKKKPTVYGSCPVIYQKKYEKRPSPPRPANEPGCRGKVHLGNDGKWYRSISNSAGIYRWVRV